MLRSALQLIKFSILSSLALSLASCGGGSGVNVDIVLSSNSSENVLLTISQNLQIGVSTGVYFVFDELEAAPVSIDDVVSGGDQFAQPNLSGVGSDPLENSFSVPTSALKRGSFYRIKMIARDTNGNVTHSGKSDCPLKVSLGEANRVKICFGVDNMSDPPVCPGLTTFSSCPGL